MIENKLTACSNVNGTRGVIRWAGQIIVTTVIFDAIFFLPAGGLNWIAGWVYLGMNILTQLSFVA